MKEWLTFVTEQAVLIIDGMALFIVATGTIQAFVGALRLLFSRSVTHIGKREIWQRYARLLVAGLTFQLAADIIESSVTAGWEAVVRLAVIAAIRTFLNYFLERDLAEVRERQPQR